MKNRAAPRAFLYTLVFCLTLMLLLAVSASAEPAPQSTMTERVHSVLLKLPRWRGDRDGWCIKQGRFSKYLAPEDRKPDDVCYEAEDSEKRSVRLLRIASAASTGVVHTMCRGQWLNDPDCDPRWKGSRVELTAALLAVGYWETAYASAIHIGHCDAMPGGCDRDRKGVPRARSYWQCWKAACPELWQTVSGTDAELLAAAWNASRLLAGFYTYCRKLGPEDPWELAFMAYGGHGCKPPSFHARRRRATMRKILAKL